MEKAIDPVLSRFRAALDKTYGERLERAVLFGSRARGDARERSDIDLAIEAPRADAHAWARIVEMVDESRTLLRFDVVRLERAAVDFRVQILAEGVVLFERRGVTSQSA